MNPRTQPAWNWERAAVLLLLLVLFAQLLNAATQLSATIDEGFHITSGYEYLRTSKLRLFDEHAPLAKALFAWPLFFVPDLQPPETAPGYPEGNLITAAQATTLAYRPIDRIIVACRIPVTLLTLLLAATVYQSARTLHSPAAGLLALTLFTFDPNLLAHGSLATTDMGATAFIFWAILAFIHYLRRPNRQRWWTAGIMLGLAQGAKLTALLLLPVLGIATLMNAWYHAANNRRWTRLLQRGLSYTGLLCVAALTLWGLYGFEVRPLPEILNGTLPLPAAAHIERGLRLRDNLNYGRETFLLGQNSMHGWWQYFPVAFILKTPLPILLLTLYTVSRFLYCEIRSHSTFDVSRLPFFVFPLLYALAALFSTIDIGYRHLLPILPFLYIGIASCKLQIAGCQSKKPLRLTSYASRFTFYVLLIWLAVGALALAPHYLPFFNEIAGGPDNGWRFLADSNTDWGQTLKALADYQQSQHTDSVKLSQFAFLDPATYGVIYDPIAPMKDAPPVLPRRFNPAPGTYAISATTLDGVPLPYPPTFDWFRHREPRAKIGHAMFIYDVQPLAGKWIAQCSQPVAPLPPEAITEGLGIERLRQLTFDCTQSWVLPDSGQSPGWYALAIPEQTALRWPQPAVPFEGWPTWIADLPQRG
ncbi:MAG: phospholipid carrier-dependent glycosyltransferase, partial [Chloroflexota bacterium]|nr:phospholipid carrier-dependent glycosyltransferase [Chloroflexota bacterium]